MDIYRIYLELLRAGLWDRPACVSGHIDVKAVLDLAQKQVTLPTVCKAMLSIPNARLSGKLAEIAEATLERCAKSHHAANTVISTVCSRLEVTGIRSILLKGQGMAACYPVPEIRQAGDIDLYVREDDYAAARGILSSMFGGESGEVEDKHTSFHVGGTLEIELHRVTNTLHPQRVNEIYQHISDEGCWKAPVALDIYDTSVLTPSDDFNAFYIFHHLWCHTSTMGIGMRQLCDWSAYLRSRNGRLDSRKIARWLKEMHLTDVWQVFGCAAVSGLGLNPEEVPLYDAHKMKRGERLLTYILDQGDNREFKHGRREQSAAKHKAGSLGYIHKRLFRMLPIFPGQAFKLYFRDIGIGLRKLLKRI